MKSKIKSFLRPFIPQFLLNRWKKWKQKRKLKIWQKNGCPVPPPNIVKHNTISEYQQKYGYNILIETGTYKGNMIKAQKSRFDKIISIELSVNLFKKAVKRFENDKNVTIIHGDSGKVLPEIISDINEPVIFWLDGHYSGGVTEKGDKESPIFEELNAILKSKDLNHILLIDDARDFTGKGDYPTISELTDFINRRNDKYKVEVKHDIIRYVI